MANALPISNEGKAQLFYVAYYGRPADPAGLAWWAQSLAASGGNLAAITSSFGNSAEATAIYGSLPVSSAVNAVYMQMFGRPAEPAGLAWWSEQITLGNQKLSDLPIALYVGAQGTDFLAIYNKLSAANAFSAALDTNPERLAYNGYAAIVPVKTWLAAIGANPVSLYDALEGLDPLIYSLLPHTPEPPAPSTPVFELSASTTLANEGQTVFFTLDTDNVAVFDYSWKN